MKLFQKNIVNKPATHNV